MHSQHTYHTTKCNELLLTSYLVQLIGRYGTKMSSTTTTIIFTVSERLSTFAITVSVLQLC